MSNELVQILNVKKYFPIQKKWFSKSINYLKAVDDITFSIRENETFSLVGESGSGKTTIGLVIAKLIDATEGSVIFKNTDILKMKEKEFRAFRTDLQIIFQNPLSALDPRMTVRGLIREPIRTQLPKTINEESKIKEVLRNVGLDDSFLDKRPFQLSGGQNQRVSIARALVTKPEFLILDEPTSALDVSIQAQIINLLKKLQKEFGLTYLFITHDLGVVNYMADRVGVMYLGKIVEIGSTDDIFSEPLHPYTQALISSVPILDVNLRNRKRIVLEGEMPSPRNIPIGCRFRSRCRLAAKICEEREPELRRIKKDRLVACHMVDQK